MQNQNQPFEMLYKIGEVVLKVLRNSQENTSVGVWFLKLQAFSFHFAFLLKKMLRHRCFSVNLASF